METSVLMLYGLGYKYINGKINIGEKGKEEFYFYEINS